METFPRYFPFVIWWRHQMETFSALLALCAENSPVPVNTPHKGQWRRVLMFSLICGRINDWVNNREAGDLRRYRGHHDVIVMRGIHRSPVSSPQKVQWRRALMHSLNCAWTNSWVNNRDAGELRRHRPHYDDTVIMRDESRNCPYIFVGSALQTNPGIVQYDDKGPFYYQWTQLLIHAGTIVNLC